MERKASATWWGTLRDGRGEPTSESGALVSRLYAVPTRFGDENGSNPEELIGAAHAGCFSMALSGTLEDAGLDPQRIDTGASVRLEKSDEGYSITRGRLSTRVEAPGADPEPFEKAANEAKRGGPVSRPLDVPPDWVSGPAELILMVRRDPGLTWA